MLQVCSQRFTTQVLSKLAPLLYTGTINVPHCRHAIDYHASPRISQRTPLFHNLEPHIFASSRCLHQPWTSPKTDSKFHRQLQRDLSSSSNPSSSLSRDGFNQSIRELHKQEVRRQAEHLLSAQGIVNASPASWQPYMRLMRIDRPIGTWLLFLPCTWSISLASSAGHLPDPSILALFALGSFFMRGAGCTINDMWDRDFDAKVARTQDRPLACGEINMLGALTFLGVQLSVSLAILLSFNWYTIVLGACALIPCIIYPLMKRVTYWPQVFLGVTFNWGSVVGWSAVHGAIDWAPVMALYGSCIAWTLVYDTVYAHQDKDDDILIGVKSTALGLGDSTKSWLVGFSVAMVSGLTTAGILCEQTWPYYAGVAYVAAHLSHQIFTVDLDNADDCSKKFRSHRNLGFVLWAAIMLGTYLKVTTNDLDETHNTATVD